MRNDRRFVIESKVWPLWANYHLFKANIGQKSSRGLATSSVKLLMVNFAQIQQAAKDK